MISLAKAQKLLPFNGDERGRALYKHLLRREKALGATLVHTTKGGHKRVNPIQVQLMCPELRNSRVDELVSEMKTYLQKSKQQTEMAIQDHYAVSVSPQIDQLFARDEEIAGLVGVLKNKVELLERNGQKSRPNLPRNANG